MPRNLYHRGAVKSQETFRLFAGDSSLSNLDQNLAINGTTVAPTFLYEGKNAGASSWTATVGEDLPIAGSGSDPTLDQGTPLTDDTNKCTQFVVNGKGYQTTSGSFAQIGANDFVLELVFKMGPSTKTMIGCYGGASYWSLYTTGAAMNLQVDYGPAVKTIQATALTVGAWYHAIVFIDRSGSGVWYVNGTQYTPIDVSATDGANLTSTQKFAIGIRADLSASDTTDASIAHAALWDSAAWLDTHLQVSIAQERFIRLCGFYPQLAKGTALPTTAARNSSAYLDIYRDSAVEIHQVGANWMRLCRRKDKDGKVLTGYLAEEQRVNDEDYSEQMTSSGGGSFSNMTADTTAVSCPDGSSKTTVKLAENNTAPGSTLFYVKTVNGLTAGQPHVWTQWIKRTSGSRNWAYFSIGSKRQWFNLDSLELGSVAGGGHDEFWHSDMGNGWTKIAIKWTPAATAEALYTSFSDTDGGLSGTGSAANSASTVFWQVEEGAFPTSYVKTSGGSATRAADTLLYKMDDGNAPGDQIGSLYTEVLLRDTDNVTDRCIAQLYDASDIGPSPSYVMLRADDTTDSLQLYVEEAGATKIFQVGATDIVDGAAHQAYGTWEAGQDSSVKIDGAAEGTPNNQASLAKDIDELRLGYDLFTASWLNGLVANVQIYKKALPGKSIAPGWEE